MHPRPLALLAGALFGLIAISPVIASDDGADPPSAPPTSSTSSTMAGSASAAPTSSTSSTMAGSASAAPTSSSTATTGPSDPYAPAPDPADDPASPDPSDDPAAPPADDPADPDPADDRAGSDTGSSTSACDAPEKVHAPAPAEGATEVYDAGEAGSVEVERISATALRIVSASPNPGWRHQVTTGSGPRVKVRFKEDGVDDPAVTRFAASLNDDGSEIHIRVTSCP